MRRSARAALVLVLVLAASAGGAAGQPPRRRAALLAWLRAGSYRPGWTAEPAAHPSAGPHGGTVRTWYNPLLVEDLAAGRSRFRRGAAMVKELFFADTAGATVQGWSVMLKVRRRSGARGNGWLFYETFDGDRTIAFGRGHRTCQGCHAAGVDFLRSPFRPGP